MAVRPNAKVTGFNDLKRAFERFGEKSLTATLKAVDDSSDDVAEEARRRAPVDEGVLRDSIETRDASPKTIRGGVGIERGSPAEDYWAVIEFGWEDHGIEAQPYMYPAAEAVRSRHQRRVVETLEGLAKEANRNV